MDNRQREQKQREKRIREPAPDEQGRPTSEAGRPDGQPLPHVPRQERVRLRE
ncbi:hypothetical protein [uncultured Deinococcus sp.]|uniref:hypothetical protein n=1 Tax=uncultured Deinococcus sp. TaxID=158789 RepID=UPI0037480C09